MSFKVAYSAPPISSYASLCSALSCDPKRLAHIMSNISDYYIEFELPKKNGGTRQIRAPKPLLKTLQRRINSRIFSHCIFPEYLQGSIKDISNPRDFVSNAKAHSKAKSVITADIKNYYPSIQAGKVKEIFKYLFKFPDEVSNALVIMTTLEGSVPQGAPTSSYIANLLFFEVEHKLVTEFSRAGLTYTRLIDDITVSSEISLNSDKKEWIVQKLRSMVKGKGLSLHKGKLKVLHTNTFGSPVVVTGLWIDRGRPRLSSEGRNSIRSQVHKVEKECILNGKTNASYHQIHDSVSGKVALMARLGHTQALKLRATLYKNMPEFSAKDSKKIEKICQKFFSKKGHANETSAYTKRFHKLMRYLSILSRTDPVKTYRLRKLLAAYPPKHKVSDFFEM